MTLLLHYLIRVMANRRNKKAEIKKKLRKNVDGEQKRVREDLMRIKQELEDIELFFMALSEVSSVEKVQVDAEDIASHINCAKDDCSQACSELDTLGNADASYLLSVLQQRLDISYDKKII